MRDTATCDATAETPPFARWYTVSPTFSSAGRSGQRTL